LNTRYFYGYNIVASGFFIQAVCIGAMFTYGVFFKEFQADFGWSRALISGASSLAFFVMGAAGILAGTLNDRIGPKLIITVSGASLGIGYMLMSRMDMPWQLYFLYGIFVGIGFSTHDVITLSTVARWFVVRRGMMSGLVKVGTGAGQLIVPLVATGLISSFGWRSSYMIIGAVSLVALVAVAQMMKRDPEDMDLLPDGGQKQFHLATKNQVASSSLNGAVRTAPFWLLCIAEFAIFFCLLTTIVHIVPHARDQGLSPAIAAGVLSTIGGVSMIGRIAMGTANDRIGGKRSLIFCFMILITSLIWLQVASTAKMLFIFAVIYGFAHGGLFTVMSPTVAELFGTASHGLLFGMILFSGTIGGSVGPLFTGYIFDLTGSYRVAFLVLTIFAVLGLFLIIILRSPKLKR
jgi:MFS family permease